MHSIRSHFKPFQPTAENSKIPHVDYEEIAPAEDLQDYIYCYWRLRSTEPLKAPFMYRVVSDGCIDILLEQRAPERVFITGFSTKYLEYDLSNSFDYLGIRFLPTGFPTLFSVAADTLVDRFIPLSEINLELASSITGKLTGQKNLQETKSVFDSLFISILKQLDSRPAIDPRLAKAIDVILKARGHLNISELDIGISERQLRRMFNFYFGQSGKTFTKIVRFQNVLGAKPSTESLKHQKIYYSEGYYDQAHFIKEFKAFYGVTPNRAFRQS